MKMAIFIHKITTERAMQEILKIFLASSSELKGDRVEFELFIGRKNKLWRKQGLFVELVIWEDFLDALSPDGLQKEYNKAIRDCDVFVMLYFTKVGKYTAEEFEAAIGAFHEGGRPLIYTYFKDDAVTIGAARREDMQSLWAFQDKLKALGHYQTVYKNTEDLLLRFGGQLERILAEKQEKGVTRGMAVDAKEDVGLEDIGMEMADSLVEKNSPQPVVIPHLEPQAKPTPKKGKVLYKIPAKMQLKNLHRCVIRVANTKRALLENLNFPEAEATILSDVRIADKMEVIVIDNPHFAITAINAPIQLVEDDDPTEWNFDVRPLSLGQFPLSFRISIILPGGKKETVLHQSVAVGTEAVPAGMEIFEVVELGESPEVEADKPAVVPPSTPVSKPNAGKTYKLGNIIKLLTNAFDATGLETFALINFEDVHRQFTGGMNQQQRILLLVTQAKNHGQLDALLAAVQAENDYQYGLCGPYEG